MPNFEEFLIEQLSDPEVRREWEALHPEREVMRAILQARGEAELTQKELAKRSGVPLEGIILLEQGGMNPDVRLLHRIAQAMGKKLHIEFRT